ncbi:MAG: hypothetical protein V3T65_00530 [Acidobacteriota bacterium]
MKLAAALTVTLAIPLFLIARQDPQLPEGWKYIGSGYMRGPNGHPNCSKGGSTWETNTR